MAEIRLNIIDFLRHSLLLNDWSHSAAQLAILKSSFGLPLTQEEQVIYCKYTGRDRYEEKNQTEVTVIAGRRSGKTTKIAAPIAIFMAFCDHGLPPGEEAFILIIAPQVAQARIAFRSIRRYLRSSPVLSKYIVGETQEQIRLSNGVIIACYPCSFIAVRGVSIIAVVCDEMDFWRHEASAANPEQEVLDALYPGMANVKNSKLIKISTPYTKSGILYREFRNRTQVDHPVWQVPTIVMHPTMNSAELARHRKRDDPTFRREFLAEFPEEDIYAWINIDVLDRCIVRGRTELPPMPGVSYSGALDPALEHDDFGLNIAHMSENGTIVLDLLVRWRGTNTIPIVLDTVLAEVKRYADRYRITTLIGDQYCFPIIQQQLLKLGLEYRRARFTGDTHAEIFGNLKSLILQRKIELLDQGEFIEQLQSLKVRARDGGRIDIRPPGSRRDDLAIVAALNCHELPKYQDCIPPFSLGLTSIGSALPAYNPFCCPVGAICGNFPCCQDEGCCLGFKDQRVG